MQARPTLIVLAQADNVMPAEQCMLPHESLALEQFNTLQATLMTADATGLNVVCVAPSHRVNAIRRLRPKLCVLDLQDTGNANAQDPMARAVATGVMASSMAPGWLLLPSHLHRITANTLNIMAKALDEHPIVLPQYQHISGYPLGFSAEFYSELTRLQHANDLRRLLNRYPGCHIDVQDPGIWGEDWATRVPPTVMPASAPITSSGQARS